MADIIKLLAQNYVDIRWAVKQGVINKDQYKEFTGHEYIE